MGASKSSNNTNSPRPLINEIFDHRLNQLTATITPIRLTTTCLSRVNKNSSDSIRCRIAQQGRGAELGLNRCECLLCFCFPVDRLFIGFAGR